MNNDLGPLLLLFLEFQLRLRPGCLRLKLSFVYSKPSDEGSNVSNSELTSLFRPYAFQNPSYNQYKEDIADSDVVEYSNVKKLNKSGKMSVDAIEPLLG